MTDIGAFAGIGLALYAAHHVGDYWIQTDWQAAKKGCAGHEGRLACLAHVATYSITQYAFVLIALAVFETDVNPLSVWFAILFSAVTHYAADRREFGIMFKLARLIPGKANFLRLGVPRAPRVVTFVGAWSPEEGQDPRVELTDNPSLGTGGWALDQSWHIALGVFVPALIACI